jgi:hypothetical protein
MTIALPNSQEDITLAWVERCLAQKWPGLRLSDMRMAKVIHGAATKIKLILDVAPESVPLGSDVPKSTWLKIGFEPHHQMMEAIYGAEAMFFATVRHLYDFHTPDCYCATWQREPFQFALFLEDLDLRRVIFNSAIEPLSPAEPASSSSPRCMVKAGAILGLARWACPARSTVSRKSSRPIISPTSTISFDRSDHSGFRSRYAIKINLSKG